VIEYLKENSQFIFLLLVWVLVGAFGGPLIYAVLPLTLFLQVRKDLYEQFFLGFWFILVLSDNLLIHSLAFSKSIKDIYLLILAFFFILKRDDFKPFNRYLLRYIPFFIVAFFCLKGSMTIGVSIQKTISYLLLFLLIPNYFDKIFRENGTAFLKDLCYLFLLIIMVGIIMKYVSPNYALSHGGRLTGLFGNPNGVGIFSVLCFVMFSIILDYFPDLFTRNERRLFFLTLIICVIFSGSRNSTVAILLFVFFSRFYKLSPFLGFLFLLIAITGTLYISSNFVNIIKSLGLESFFRVETLEKAGGRYIAWEFALQNIQQSVFFGKGFAYDEFLMRKNFDYLSKLGHEGGVHNSYLILWLNTGLVGLTLYLIAFFSSFIQARINSSLSLPAMFTIMFTIMFEPWIVASLNPFTIVFLMIITLLLNPMYRESQPVTDEGNLPDPADTGSLVPGN
jgi:O-antigen ligase